jgi:hypothetical protein
MQCMINELSLSLDVPQSNSLVDPSEITTRASQTNGQLNRQSLRTIWEVGLNR